MFRILERPHDFPLTLAAGVIFRCAVPYFPHRGHL